jgi:hypothetical protein
VINNNRFKSLNLNCWVWLNNTKWKNTKLARLLLWAAKQDMSKKKGKVEKNTESEKFRRSVSQYSVMVPNNNWRAFFILSHVATQSKLLQCYYYILRIVLLCTVHRWIQNLSFFKSFIILLPRGFIMSFLRSGHTHLHFKCTVFILWISMNQYCFPKLLHLICNTVLCTVSFFNNFPNIHSIICHKYLLRGHLSGVYDL